MQTSFELAMKKLTEYNIKPSYQRTKILEYLMSDSSHPTADIIYTNIKQDAPTISKATVYNTLNLFLDKGLVSPMSVDAETRYDLVTENHGHFVCNKCERIFNFPYKYSNKYDGLDGFNIEEEEIILKGICTNCKKQL